MPLRAIIRRNAVNEAARKGGTLPNHPPATRYASAFVAGYALAAPTTPGAQALGKQTQRDMAALRGGMRRKKVEAGLNTTTDAKALVSPTNKHRF